MRRAASNSSNMARFAKMISSPMSRATSIVVLAGCLLLGFLVGMSPVYTGRRSESSGSGSTNLRATDAQAGVPASSVIPATPPQQLQEEQQQASKTPSRLAEAQLFKVTRQELAVDNTDETVEGVGHHVPGSQELPEDNTKDEVADVTRFDSRSPKLLEDPEPFFWGETFPSYQDLDFDQFAVPVEESLAYIDTSYSYDFVGLDLVGLSASSPLSLSYEF